MTDYKAKFMELTRTHYADQAKWFLNGFWKEGAEEEAENIWTCTHKFIELDTDKKKEGNELDEFQAHKFLESLGETLTVIKLREKLRDIDLDANGKMALLEYLCFKYSKEVEAVVDSPQGDNTEEIEEAQAKLEAVQSALLEVQQRLEEQRIALEQQKAAKAAQEKALAEQKRAEEEVKAAEDSVRAAENELKAAVDDLKAQEDAYNSKVAELEAKSKDGSSMVQRNKAAAELAQLKQEDPLPLRRAKITQEAALRKVEKQRKEAEAATAAAQEKTKAVEQKVRELEEKVRQVEEAARQCEAAVREMEARFQEAQDFLEEVKKKGGVAHGAIWWMERELTEAKKYMPQKKGGIIAK